MTHTPPIPAGNQSPYPLQEAPHKPAAPTPPAPPPGDPRIARKPHAPAVPVPTAIAVAAGVGLAAIAGGIFYALSGSRPKKRKSRKRRSPKSAQA